MPKIRRVVAELPAPAEPPPEPPPRAGAGSGAAAWLEWASAVGLEGVTKAEVVAAAEAAGLL